MPGELLADESHEFSNIRMIRDDSLAAVSTSIAGEN
jgi:hypothetical protein